MLAALGVGVEEDIDVVALNSAAAILRGVDDTVDHDFAAVGDDARVYGNGMAGSCNGAGAGAAAPAFRTLFARAVAGGAEEAEGF